jgi:hypothetical protein
MSIALALTSVVRSTGLDGAIETFATFGTGAPGVADHDRAVLRQHAPKP